MHKLLTLLGLLMVALVHAEGAEVDSGVACLARLRSSIGTTYHREKVFPEAEQEKVAAFFESVGERGLPQKLIEELELILGDSEFLIAAGLSDEYRNNVFVYVEGGGRFVMNMDYYKTELGSSLFTGIEDGAEKIEIPAYKLIRVIAGNLEEKKSLVSDIVHELQHSISNQRKKAELEQRLGIKIKGAVSSRMSAEEWISYVYQSEVEAIAAERKFVPKASNSALPVRYYPALQALQSLLNLFKSDANIKNFDEHLRAHRLFAELTHQYVDDFLLDLQSCVSARELNKKEWGFLDELKTTKNFEETLLKVSLATLDIQLRGIEDRLMGELRLRLVDKVKTVLRQRLPSIDQAYRDILRERSGFLP